MQLYKYLLLFSVFIYVLIILYFHTGILKVTTNHIEQHISPWDRQGVAPIRNNNKVLQVEFVNRNQTFDKTVRKENSDFIENEYEDNTNLDKSCKMSENSTQTKNCVFSANGSFYAVGNIYIFSAYYDNRNLDSVRIRLIGMRRLDRTDTIICGLKSEFYKFQSIAEEYELSENHGKLYGGWIFSCQLPSLSTIKPQNIFLSISTNENNGILDFDKATVVPVQHYSNRTLNSTTTHQSFGVCIPPIFGDLSLTRLIQFIELTRILGANQITIYNYNVSNNLEKILKHYTEKGYVELVDWKLPRDVTMNQIWYNGQLLTVQDCLHRNIGKFQLLGFTDLDEFIIPRKKYNWEEMIKSIIETISLQRKIQNIAGFSFKSAFFNPKQVPDASQQLIYLQLLKRTLLLSSLRTKVMVYPEKIFEMGIHHISKTLFQNLTVIDVPSTLGIIHHYRSCGQTYEQLYSMDCDITMKDTDILRYANELVDRYRTTILDTVNLYRPLIRHTNKNSTT